MPIREFELFHGAVLAKLLRSEKPIALRLIETRPSESWSTYTLNDTVDLFISHSKTSRTISLSRGGGTSWSFPFSPNQLRQINENLNRPVFVALVCGRPSPLKGEMQVCLLDPEQIAEIFDKTSVQQSITIRKPGNRGRLRVFKNRQQRFLIPRSRLDNWDVPGS